MGTFKKFRKKSHKAEKSLTKPKSLIVPKKVRTFYFGILVKILAHTHGFEHETSGLKSKHLTTRPRTRETCELPREIRVVARKKKHPHFPITLAYRKCNKYYCCLVQNKTKVSKNRTYRTSELFYTQSRKWILDNFVLFSTMNCQISLKNSVYLTPYCN